MHPGNISSLLKASDIVVAEQFLRSYMLIFLLTYFILPSYGQDTYFSQFYANRAYLNPAFTAIESGITITGISRTQWFNVDSGFKTNGITFEKRESVSDNFAFGIGIDAYQSKEGNTQYLQQSIGLLFAPMIALGDQLTLHTGFKSKYVNQRLDLNSLVFSDQLDPVFGNIFGSAVVPDLDRTSYFDLDVGILLRFETGTTRGQSTLTNIRGHFGASIRSVTTLLGENTGAEYSFFNASDSRLPQTFILHTGLDIPIIYLRGVDNEITFSPNIRYENRQGTQLVSSGLYFLYKTIYLGSFLQSRTFIPLDRSDTHSVIFIGGFYVPTKQLGSITDQKLFIGLSASFDTTGIGTRAGSIYEIAMRYNFSSVPNLFSRAQNRASKILDCKNFF